MKKKRRVFLGYALSTELQQRILHWRSQFADFPVRWIAPENLHVTLVPPWYEHDVASVIVRLQNTSFLVTPFSFSFATVTFGPDFRSPRLIWAKGETPQAFITLKNQVTEIVQQKQEKRSPLLHTTLARFRSDQFAVFPTKQFAEVVNWQETLTGITVFESHLKRTGAVYEKLAEISLR